MSFNPRQINTHYIQEFVPTYQLKSDYLPTRVTEGERDVQASEVVKINHDNLVEILSAGEEQRTRLLQPTSRVQPKQVQVRQSLRKRQNRPAHQRVGFQQNGEEMIIFEVSSKSNHLFTHLYHYINLKSSVSPSISRETHFPGKR